MYLQLKNNCGVGEKSLAQQVREVVSWRIRKLWRHLWFPDILGTVLGGGICFSLDQHNSATCWFISESAKNTWKNKINYRISPKAFSEGSCSLKNCNALRISKNVPVGWGKRWAGSTTCYRKNHLQSTTRIKSSDGLFKNRQLHQRRNKENISVLQTVKMSQWLTKSVRREGIS